MSSIPVGQVGHACAGCPHDVKPASMHESDLSGEVDLLHCLLDDCKAEIRRLREELGIVQPEIRWTGDGREPTLAYPDDAGFDLYCRDSVHIRPGQFVDVQCGICIQLPAGFWGLIMGRSSTLRSKGLLVNTAVIDTGYTGPLFVGVKNLAPTTCHVTKGERLAQLIPVRNWAERVALTRVEQLGPSSRGDKGFGSSGR